MGDVVMTTPALRAIRAARPDAHLALLTSPSGAAVAALVDEVDEVIEYEAPWLKPDPSDGVDAARDLAFIEDLAARRFDAAVIFTVHSQSALPAALACHLARIPLRLAHCRENPYHLLTDWVPDPEPDAPIRHEVQRQLDLVASVGYRTEERPPLDPRPASRRSPDAGVGTRRRPRRRPAVARDPSRRERAVAALSRRRVRAGTAPPRPRGRMACRADR